jgi:uncharacterized protein (TIGR01244 family)
MKRHLMFVLVGGFASAVILAQVAKPVGLLATVKVPMAVLADAKPLPAGTYEVRLSSDAPPTPVAGQASRAERWVEFVREGTLAGRELATVVADADIESVAKGAHPKPNEARVDVLKGGEYVRVWINKDANHYLINLSVTQSVIKSPVPGIMNLARVGTRIACAGTLDAARAIPAIKQMGFVTIINLRESTEPGADIESEREAAERAGLRYVHLPFSTTAPDSAVAAEFLAAITAAGAEPAFVHCATGNRAAAMWLIKRVVVDRWDVDRATAEATELGLSNAPLRQFAIDYARRRSH